MGSLLMLKMFNTTVTSQDANAVFGSLSLKCTKWNASNPGLPAFLYKLSKHAAFRLTLRINFWIGILRRSTGC